jgi:hypothetical protein
MFAAIRLASSPRRYEPDARGGLKIKTGSVIYITLVFPARVIL